MQGAREALRRQGLGLAAISYDPVATLAGFAQGRSITFPLLSDSGSEVIRRYGLLNTSVPSSNPTFGIPFPGTIIVDREGRVKARYFETAYQTRHTVSSILADLGHRTQAPATRISSPQLDITTYSTDAAAAAGTAFALVLDLEPKPGMHIYAPGVLGYRPVSLAIDPQPFVQLDQPRFPASETYEFKPLKELVQVYRKPFRIRQDIRIDASGQAQTALKGVDHITITGTLTYQACDDNVCFNPTTIPVSWTVQVKALDRERGSGR
jgi:hypothetical protein